MGVGASRVRAGGGAVVDTAADELAVDMMELSLDWSLKDELPPVVDRSAFGGINTSDSPSSVPARP